MYLVELDYIFTRLIPRISRLVSGGPFHRPTEYQRFPLILCACPLPPSLYIFILCNKYKKKAG